MLAAQLKVQQWEIENYKQKLIHQEITMADFKGEIDTKKLILRTK